MNNKNLIIGGDFFPTKSNAEQFALGNIDALVDSELKHILRQAQFRIFNIEGPLTNQNRTIAKAGPNLMAYTKTAAGIKAIGTDIAILANNHILDQGESGMLSTFGILKKNGIIHIGAGYTRKDAVKAYCFEWENRKIGLYACAEHEFSIATDHSAGANPFDWLNSPDHVSELKSQCDYVIVFYHGGKEHYRYPSPNLQKVCRYLVKRGANLVVCQQSHCIGCEENYLQGKIIYGQGNFLFDYDDNEYARTGLVIQVSNSGNISYIPIEKDKNKVKLATGESAEKIIRQFQKRSEEIKRKGFVEQKYAEYAGEMLDRYLYFLSAPNSFLSFLFRGLERKFHIQIISALMKRKYNGSKLLTVQNYIECEAHRELLLFGIKNRLKNEEKA